MARIVALIFNWWSLFTRIASGDKHGEAITTRPQFLEGIARYTSHANQRNLSISSLHAKARQIGNVMASISTWLQSFQASAEQLAVKARWPLLLRRIFRHFCLPEVSPPPLIS